MERACSLFMLGRIFFCWPVWGERCIAAKFCDLYLSDSNWYRSLAGTSSLLGWREEISFFPLQTNSIAGYIVPSASMIINVHPLCSLVEGLAYWLFISVKTGSSETCTCKIPHLTSVNDALKPGFEYQSFIVRHFKRAFSFDLYVVFARGDGVWSWRDVLCFSCSKIYTEYIPKKR